jgi:tetratricopeptide (TPR) repeat protein
VKCSAWGSPWFEGSAGILAASRDIVEQEGLEKEMPIAYAYSYMSIDALGNKVNLLFRQSKWAKARKLLEAEREKEPADHWVLTQLGVAFYEERSYQEALQLFVASLQLVEDCPLTLWNLAGVLDSLDRHNEAVPIYTRLLKANTSPDEDPCWESKEWADALKADCVYRLGLCFEHLGKREVAEHCYRQYMNLLATGIEGSYSVADVLGKIRGLSADAGVEERKKGLRNAIKSTLTAVGPKSRKNGAPRSAPGLNTRKLLPGKLASSKR